VSGSYDGPSANLTKTNVDDHWELYFDFTQPLPKLKAQEIMVVTFTARHGNELKCLPGDQKAGCEATGLVIKYIEAEW